MGEVGWGWHKFCDCGKEFCSIFVQRQHPASDMVMVESKVSVFGWQPCDLKGAAEQD